MPAYSGVQAENSVPARNLTSIKDIEILGKLHALFSNIDLLVALNFSQSLCVSLNLSMSISLASISLSLSFTDQSHCVIDFGLQKGEAKSHYSLLLFGLS